MTISFFSPSRFFSSRSATSNSAKVLRDTIIKMVKGVIIAEESVGIFNWFSTSNDAIIDYRCTSEAGFLDRGRLAMVILMKKK